MRIVDFLKSFTNEELKEFEKVVASPFFNEGRNLLPFLREIKKFQPGYSDNKLTEAYLYTKIYPDRPFNKQVTKNALSKLVKMAEEYICFKKLTSSNLNFNIYLAEALLERDIRSYSKLKVNRAEREIKKSLINSNYFRDYYNLTRIKSELSGFETNISNSVRDFNDEAGYFINDSLIKIISLFQKMNTMQRNYNTNFNPELVPAFLENVNIDKIMQYIREKPFKNKEILEFHYYLFKISRDENDEDAYENLKKTFSKISKSLSKVERVLLIANIINACQTLFHIDDLKYSRESFSLHKELLFKHLKSANSKMLVPYPVLRNVLYLAFKLDEFKWLEKFIDKNQQYFEEQYKNIMLNYSLAFLEFGRKNYLKSLEYVKKAKTPLVQFKLDLRLLELMNYYDLNYMEEAFRTLRNFKKFLNETKYISNAFREPVYSFVKYYEILFKCREGKGNIIINKLSKDIEANKRTFFHKWIITKVNELKEI